MPYTTVHVYHTPLEAVFQARLLDNQEGANTERYVVGKLSARCFQRRASWYRHYSNCGDVDHGHSAQEGVINTVLYGMLASRVVRTNSKHSVPSHACAGAIPYSEIRQAEIFTRPREIRSEDEGRQAEIHRTVRNSEAVILLSLSVECTEVGIYATDYFPRKPSSMVQQSCFLR